MKRDILIKKCEHCGKIFHTYHHNKIYCSFKCCDAARREREAVVEKDRICRYCGKHFNAKAYQMYCSEECGENHHAMLRQQKNCFKCEFSIKVGRDLVCNYHEITSQSRTILGKADTPCQLFSQRGRRGKNEH